MKIFTMFLLEEPVVVIDSMLGSVGRWRTKHLSSDNGRLAKGYSCLDET